MSEDHFARPSSDRSDLFSILRSISIESDVESPIPMRDLPGIKNIFAAYDETVCTYTARNVSFQSNILRAFVSILNMVCRQMTSDIFFGLPVLAFDWNYAVPLQQVRRLKRR